MSSSLGIGRLRRDGLEGPPTAPIAFWISVAQPFELQLSNLPVSPETGWR